MNIILKLQRLLDSTRAIDFVAPLALRLYLAPVFFMAGMSKYNSFDDTAAWFGNSEWGLGLPFPELMTFLATSTEIVGAACLLLGFAVRWMCIPLMVTMLVAAFSVHWVNGWQAIADAKFCLFNCADAIAAGEKLSVAKDVLREHSNYDWITEQGGITILNNGIEFAATYFVMLLVLFFIGSGKYLGIDYWIKEGMKKN